MQNINLIRQKIEDIQLNEFIPKEKNGFVYLLYSGGKLKIGMSKKPKERIKNIKTSSPLPVFIICVRFFSNAKEIEKLLHEYFKTYRTKGEWFDLSREQVFECCDLLEMGWYLRVSESLEKPLKHALLLEL